MSLLIYGVTGYTGHLIIKEALAKGIAFTIAGRNAEKIQSLAVEFNLPSLSFGLDDQAVIIRNIRPFSLVLNVAGPYSYTTKPMAEACLEAGVHYVDLCGELDLLDWFHSQHDRALEKKVALVGGAGFNHTPTNCVAGKLHEFMPDATHLELAVHLGGGSISHGTMSSMILLLGESGTFRKNGILQSEPLGKKRQTIDFGVGIKNCISIPWGDINASWYSTKISNIRTYTSASFLAWLLLKGQFLLNPVLRSTWFRKQLQHWADRKFTGPSHSEIKLIKTRIYGKVWNDSGQEKELLVECAESYIFSARSAIKIVQRMMENPGICGYKTPAQILNFEDFMSITGTGNIID